MLNNPPKRNPSRLAVSLAEAIGRGSVLIADSIAPLRLSDDDLAYIRERVAWYVLTDSAILTMEEILEQVPWTISA